MSSNLVKNSFQWCFLFFDFDCLIFEAQVRKPNNNKQGVIILTKYVAKISEPPGKIQVLSSVLYQITKILQQFYSLTYQVCPKKSL